MDASSEGGASPLKESIRNIYRKIEAPVVYFAIFAYLLLKLLVLFIEPVKMLFVGPGEVPFLLALVLMMLKIIDGKLESRSQIGIVKQFAKDLSQRLDSNEHSTVLVFAVTGDYYKTVLLQMPLRARFVKILLRKPAASSIVNPAEQAQIPTFHSHCKANLVDFTALPQHGHIQNVEVRYYDFDSLLHFMVVDSSLVHYGLLMPNKKHTGTDVMPSRIEADNSLPSGYKSNNINWLGLPSVSVWFCVFISSSAKDMCENAFTLKTCRIWDRLI